MAVVRLGRGEEALWVAEVGATEWVGGVQILKGEQIGEPTLAKAIGRVPG